MLTNLTFSRRRHRALRAFFRLLLYQANYPAALDYAHSLADFRETLRALLVDSDGLALFQLINALPEDEVIAQAGFSASQLMIDVAFLGQWREIKTGLELFINDFVPVGRLPLTEAFMIWEMEVFHENTPCYETDNDLCFSSCG